jgi:beta-phosphoglucomutase-like phosphatase (HAD superfamily)
VLGSQEKTKREAAAQNAALAEKYGMQIGNEQLRLLMQGLTGTGQMLRSAQAVEAAQARAARADKAANAPTSTVRTIQYALTLPENDPQRKLILASVAGTPENIAAMVAKAQGIQDTKPPPKAGKPRYRRGADGTVYVSRD